MRKITLLVASILVIGLVGCKPKTNEVNNNKENMQNENTVNKRKAEKDKYGRKGEDHWKSKRVVQLSLNGELIKIYGSIREASRETKFHHESIRHCCKRDNKEYKGFKWMYYKDYIQLKGEIDNGDI